MTTTRTYSKAEWITAAALIVVAVVAFVIYSMAGGGHDKYANDPAFTRIDQSTSRVEVQGYVDMAESGADAAPFGSPAKVRFADMETRALDRLNSLK